MSMDQSVAARSAEAPRRPALEDIVKATPPPATAQRLISLDVFRGITIAAMLLVNNPGSGKAFAPSNTLTGTAGLRPT